MKKIERTSVCLVCGKKFKPRINHHKLQQFCSKNCANEGKKKTVVRICKVCGKAFTRRPSDLRKGTGEYCSWSCQRSIKKNRVALTCQFCGKAFERIKSRANGNQGKFCCLDCKVKGQDYLIGPKNPNYVNGGAHRDYCEKWTADLRRRVRKFFNNTCVMCGLHQKDHFTKSGKHRLLHVHHVNYDKNQCCDESIPRLLIPLCISCHNKTTVKREIWEPYLTKLIINNYGGKCFYTKEEYKQIIICEKTLNTTNTYPMVTGGEL